MINPLLEKYSKYLPKPQYNEHMIPKKTFPHPRPNHESINSTQTAVTPLITDTIPSTVTEDP